MCPLRRLTILAVLLLGTLPSLARADTGGPRLEVTVVGLRNHAGQVLCALYVSAEAFPAKAELAFRRQHVGIVGQQARCLFDNVPPGTYAVAVIHDENANFKLDTNFLGIPREGVGVSRDAKGFLGPPRFNDARFHYDGGDLSLVIHMVYL